MVADPNSTGNMPPLVEVRDLHVRFGRNAVLRDINLTVPRGQTLAIIGESGCGKTVLLKTIIGLVRPTRGSVLFDGADLQSLSDKELTRQRIRYGFLFQQAALFDSMTIGQNVAFPLRQHMSMTRDELRQVVRTRLAEVGLPEAVIPMRPAELSGGMRKRVGLARALAMETELLLCDEAKKGLEPIMSEVINELILRTRNQYSVTGIVVTHDMRTATKVADRIVMLCPLARTEPGQPQIVFDGLPAEIEQAADRRVKQFVRGEAGERLMEMRETSRQMSHREDEGTCHG
jgi:phospholipid/cholesterol/gamma-HCH transport system ATP-binding protein